MDGILYLKEKTYKKMKSISLRRVFEFTILALLVLGFRVLFQELMPMFQENLNLTFGKFLVKLLSNYPLTLSMLLLDFAIVYIANRYIKERWPYISILFTFLSSLLIAVLSALWIRIPIWSDAHGYRFFADIYFNLTLFTSFVFNLVIVSSLHIYFYYTTKQERALKMEIGKKNKARYQYTQLKNQLNPHFLFNSLNVLDYLIFEDQQRASDFVRKLSSVYRYLLKKEDKPAVRISEEIEFVCQYFDLLKERFRDALTLNLSIPDDISGRYIIPGGLQMLVENAVKHNMVSQEHPLIICIFADNNMIVVKNNLQLRMTTIDSGGVGLKSIKGQYQYLFNKDISVISGPDFFQVELPIIDSL
ncbi:MAG: hypothetical protein BGO30_04685 [Bacteroidetes bacterium 41-46]|nr:MAG: hypothetical protein BGO30_04685 [Bacteroidetes bacterium 41-46]